VYPRGHVLPLRLPIPYSFTRTLWLHERHLVAKVGADEKVVEFSQQSISAILVTDL
jgi:hypothetical protein